MAVIVHGFDRTTTDIDAVIHVEEETIPNLLAALARHRLKPRNENPIEFFKRHRILLVQSEQELKLDLSVAALPFEINAIQTSIKADFGTMTIPVIDIDHLLIMKFFAGRPKDLADSTELLALKPKLDIKYIRKTLRDFSDVMEEPEIIDCFERALNMQP